jgi:hypothetical protein
MTITSRKPVYVPRHAGVDGQLCTTARAARDVIDIERAGEVILARIGHGASLGPLVDMLWPVASMVAS